MARLHMIDFCFIHGMALGLEYDDIFIENDELSEKDSKINYDVPVFAIIISLFFLRIMWYNAAMRD